MNVVYQGRILRVCISLRDLLNALCLGYHLRTSPGTGVSSFPNRVLVPEQASGMNRIQDRIVNIVQYLYKTLKSWRTMAWLRTALTGSTNQEYTVVIVQKLSIHGTTNPLASSTTRLFPGMSQRDGPGWQFNVHPQGKYRTSYSRYRELLRMLT